MAMKAKADSTNVDADRHFAAARKVLVAGISGAARENTALGRPMLAARGDGAWTVAPDGTRYIDLHGGYGATILGHNHPRVRAAIERALDMGIVLGPETLYQERLAARLVEVIPSAELVRYASSGTEATMSAIRLARAHTGRDKILKFEGHFHGLHELVVFSTHPPARPPAPGELLAPIVDSGGVPAAFAGAVVVAPWNDIAAAERAFREHGNDLAAVIMEPVHYNAGCILPDPEYLRVVRDLATRAGTVLIYDEILSGFRTGIGGAQGHFEVFPDVTLLGKAVANGVPIAVIVGKREVMESFSPLGTAAHSGTFSGHLFGVLASLATLEELSAPGFYDGPAGILAMAERLYSGLREVFARAGLNCSVNGFGTRFALYFGQEPDFMPRAYQDITGCDTDLLRRFARACFEKEVVFHTYDVVIGHHGFGQAHDAAVIDEALNRIESACATL